MTVGSVAAGALGLDEPLDRPAHLRSVTFLVRHLHGRPGRGGIEGRYATELVATIGSPNRS